MMIDTQVLSYAFKGSRGHSAQGMRISSVVANEFLEVYDKNSSANFNYYIAYHPGHFGAQMREAPATRRSRLVDQIVFNFGSDYPALVEYGSRSVAGIINDRNNPAFQGILASLDKDFRKRMRTRFAFMCANLEGCVPLTMATAKVGIDLLAKFTETNNIKGSLRNSVNDMMILASAIRSREVLITRDNLLGRFAAKTVGGVIAAEAEHVLTIDFKGAHDAAPSRSKESKGYINRGWQIAGGRREHP